LLRGVEVASGEELEKYRKLLHQKGITGLSDSEVEAYIRSTRKQLLFWSIVILGILMLTSVIVWRDVH
jgi:hypothetical protein